MRETDNFNLTIPEGSDNVNILTQVTPNFETIDGIMKDNENAGVQVATVLYSNNIHAITRTKDDASVMRFTATSRFTLGDTFTVDGVQVTALAPTGEQLPDGAFIVGSEVLAILKGTLLTIFAGAKATDSAKLNGQSASFYATKAEVDNAQTLAEASATIAQNAMDAIEEISSYSYDEVATKAKWVNGKTIYKKTIKYTNGNPIGNVGSTVNINIPHDISQLGSVLKVEGFAITSGVSIALPISTGNTSSVCVANVTSNNIVLRLNNETWSTRDFYFTLYYTK